MIKFKKLFSIILISLLLITIIGCGDKEEEYDEPSVINTNLYELKKDNSDYFSKSYRLNVLVKSDTFKSNGYMVVTDTTETVEMVISESTVSNAILWNKSSGKYEFNNPNNFLTESKSSKIKQGYELKILALRKNENELVCVIEEVIEHEVSKKYEEPSIDVLKFESIINKSDTLDMKYAYKSSVIVKDLSSKNQSGQMKVTDLNGLNETTVTDSTLSRSALSWNEIKGYYEFNNPNDFLTNDKTSKIEVGDTLEVLVVRENKTIKIIILSINHQEEDLLTYANYNNKNLNISLKKNVSRVRVANLYTDLTDLSKVELKFTFDGGNVTYIPAVDANNHYYFGIFVTPNGNLEGSFTLSCEIVNKETGVKLVDIEQLEINIYSSYVALQINETDLPIKVIGGAFNEIVTIGYYSFDSSVSLSSLVSFDENHKVKLPIIGTLSNGSTEIDYQKLSIKSSDENILKVDNDGMFSLGTSSGLVKITVSDKINSDINTSITFEIISNGINISKYDELMEITKNVKDKEYVIVLKDNIELCDKINTGSDSFNYELYIKSCLTKINSTADVTYYKNTNQLENATVYYAVEISTDLYGNGYSISSDNITQKLYSKYGYRIFRGPLDLVRYNKEYNGGENNLAVKAQDNISFVVLKDNIKITNVELKGCNDESVISSTGEYDLTNLDYCGTVLEIIGNNCEVSYSRINNGRTAVRVFGKAHTDSSFNVSDYRITTTITNTLFSNAREFLLKIGTNQIVKNESVVNKKITNPVTSDYDDASPYLTYNNKKYLVDNDNYKDSDFYNNYILNDITVKDCVFMNAGLFSIGLETTFGGLVLHGWDFSDSFKFGSELGWSGISGTSYPSLLRLKGDVRFYDWKKVSSVNSDTLIEGLKDSNGNLSTIASRIGFNLDFGNLLNEYYKTHESILASYNGENYVNGAIAYYGGGKNYSCVDMSEVGPSFTNLIPYSVEVDNFAKDNPKFIYYTAGLENFRFLLYDATSSLTVAKQYNDLSDSSAYDILKK